MEALTAHVQALAGTADDAGRQEIMDTLRDLQYSLEAPYDTMQRLSCLVSTWHNVCLTHFI